MRSYRRFHRILFAAAFAGGLLVVAGTPAFAFGYRGDARQVAALRGAGPDRDGSGGAPHASGAAPEIDAGAAANAIALAVGGLLVILDRRRR